mmetsp:Transcript_26072/g.38580  ORF Transcript_26072/g.38580 Transcript_26072/m.38580 type:complete len:258 (-) Transcript_26072:261-1034(-)
MMLQPIQQPTFHQACTMRCHFNLLFIMASNSSTWVSRTLVTVMDMVLNFRKEFKEGMVTPFKAKIRLMDNHMKTMQQQQPSNNITTMVLPIIAITVALISTKDIKRIIMVEDTGEEIIIIAVTTVDPTKDTRISLLISNMQVMVPSHMAWGTMLITFLTGVVTLVEIWTRIQCSQTVHTKVELEVLPMVGLVVAKMIMIDKHRMARVSQTKGTIGVVTTMVDLTVAIQTCSSFSSRVLINKEDKDISNHLVYNRALV